MMQSPTFSIDTPEGMKAAVVWTRALIATIAQGGVWIVPRSMSIYLIDHAHKRVTRNAGYDSAIERVFNEMGWTVRVP